MLSKFVSYYIQLTTISLISELRLRKSLLNTYENNYYRIEHKERINE